MQILRTMEQALNQLAKEIRKTQNPSLRIQYSKAYEIYQKQKLLIKGVK